MPDTCCIVGCTNRKSGINKSLSFYKIPSRKTPFEQKRREDWIRAVNRPDWDSWSYERISKAKICSAHFISGSRSEHDQNSPDWVPNIFAHRSRHLNYIKMEGNYHGILNVETIGFTNHGAQETNKRHAYSNSDEAHTFIKQEQVSPIMQIDNTNIDTENTTYDVKAIKTETIPLIEVYQEQELLPNTSSNVEAGKIKQQFEGMVFFCDECNLSFTSKVSLDIHLEMHSVLHNEENSQLAIHSVVNIEENFQLSQNLSDKAHAGSSQLHSAMSCNAADFKSQPLTNLAPEEKLRQPCSKKRSKKQDKKSIRSNESFKCTDCQVGIFFSSSAQLKSHMKSVHNKAGVSAKKSTRLRHKSPVAEEIIFPTKRTNRQKNVLFSCGVCEKTFRSELVLKQHIVDSHTFDIESTLTNDFAASDAALSNAEIQTTSSTKVFECNFCHKCFTQKTYLTKHQRICSLNTIVDVNSDRKIEHECGFCGKSFNLKRDLQKHIKAHLTKPSTNTRLPDVPEKYARFQCVACNKCFTNEHNLQLHVDGRVCLKIHECIECDRTFETNAALSTHTKMRHQHRKSKCHECGRFFSTSADLRHHQRDHDDTTPFHCEKCGSNFRFRGSLNSHLCIGESDSYSCYRCSKTFGKEYDLTMHSRICQRK